MNTVNISMRTFRLVDFAAHFQKGFRNHVVPITEVPSLMETFNHYGCYATYFFYSDEVLTHMHTRGVDSLPTIAGFRGKVWAPYLPMDLDDPDLLAVTGTTRLLVSYLMDRWQIDPNGLQLYFSGSKGFHVMLDTRLFGRIVPSKTLPMLFASMRAHLTQVLPTRERGTVDLGIKDRVRLFRLPNTINEKSGLYKIPISLEQLERLRPQEIMELAREPHALTVTDETGLISKATVNENPAAARFYRRARRQIRQVSRKPFMYRFHRTKDPGRGGFSCKGMQAIWQSHVKSGVRNNCAIRLASGFRLCGLTEEETQAQLLDWNTKNDIQLPPRELENVVRSAYQNSFPYRYGCGDPVLRNFCPLATLTDCQHYLTDQQRGQGVAGNPHSGEKGGSRIKA